MKRIFSLKILSFILYTLAGLLFVGFIWSSYLSINQPATNISLLNIQGIDSLFTFLSKPFAIAAATLAILTLAITTSRTIRMDKQLERMDKQLIEMKAQREASYQPDVIIVQSQFLIQTGTGEPIIDQNAHRILGKDDKIYLKINLDDKGFKEPKLFLHNIGRGVAKNFRYRFYYDVKNCIDQMKLYGADNYFTINNVFGFDYVEILTRGTPMTRFWGFYPTKEWINKINFILPIDKEVLSTEILVSYLYVILNFFKDEIHLQYGVLNKERSPYLQQSFPKLYFECEYMDIGLKPYKKKFELDISAMSYRQLLDNNYRFNDITYDYNIIPTEIKA